MEKWRWNFSTIEINLTFSKIVAVLILACAVYLDIKNGGISAFMFSVPFIVILVTGKQAIDWGKQVADSKK